MSPRRKVIGENPLSAIDQMVGPETPEAPAERPKKPKRSGRAKPGSGSRKPVKRPKPSSATAARRAGTRESTKRDDGPAKVRATFHIPGELLDECRDAVVALSGPPERLTLAHLAEEALRRQVERLKRQHNDGADFAPRSSELRGGRPIGS